MKVWLPAIRGGSGADIFTHRLAAALRRRNIGAEVSWYPTYFQFAPLLLSYLPAPADTDIVHALSWSSFAFQRKGIPLVVTEQLDVLDPHYQPYRSFGQGVYHETLIRQFVRASFKAAASITAVSQATATSLARTLDTSAIQIVYNSVDTRVFHPATTSHHPDSPFFRLLFVGNLTRRKGADLLIPIMKKLGARFELRFTSGLRDLTLKNIEPNMTAIGRLNSDVELVTAYRDCDALLFPSRLEGLPIAPLEAMACGKPVIAAHASSLPEVVEDGVTGTLCAPNNIDAFVSACRDLADSPERLRVYGEAARDRVEKLFSEDVIIPQYLSLYEKLLGRDTPR
jgi:alpha-maltose-1-phosphate synthase